MADPLWPYCTPGIPDDRFERLPGIPMTELEVRMLILAQLRLRPDAVLWDIGAGTGTIPVEVGQLCPGGQIVAIERDEEVAGLIRRNCQRFGVKNVSVVEGSAPDCLGAIAAPSGGSLVDRSLPDCILIEGGQPLQDVLRSAWDYTRPGGRIVATTSSLEGLYAISEFLAELQARDIEVVQSAINRLQRRGIRQSFSAVNPTFILSGEKG
ncbi:MAG: precorrin-6Y C5,15-methyltransferase subunit CbiT [Synechococcales cyanobacterium RM1_1_8]|nr:precorrin-6Y C5,15-methyltransferase subunit CbiT [Synechococcales cyanobacterium RM1_1_8]